MREWIGSVDFDIFVIGVGAEIDEHFELRVIGRSGAALSKRSE